MIVSEPSPHGYTLNVFRLCSMISTLVSSIDIFQSIHTETFESNWPPAPMLLLSISVDTAATVVFSRM